MVTSINRTLFAVSDTMFVCFSTPEFTTPHHSSVPRVFELEWLHCKMHCLFFRSCSERERRLREQHMRELQEREMKVAREREMREREVQV